MREIQRTINNNYKISNFLVLFLVHSIQVGVGILGFQQTIVGIIGNDSWISVILAGLLVHIIIWMLYKILKYGRGDLITIQRDIFGKWFGGVLSFIWLIYFTLIGIAVLRTYIEIVQVWMFPNISVTFLSFLLLSLVYYIVIGGFKAVAGICFLGMIIPLYLILTLIFPLNFAEFQNILPIWNHSLKEFAISSKHMIISYLGFSTLLMYYPFIKQPEKSQKWAHVGTS
ncbi:hypothetical protein E3U55_12510 [Filobacillus milosensis]|uniref:Uncharacterized protein n=1 Tax=Filobacillus milosensis TaxID=94137 RepID=A0A4Y8IEZ8_9BACI|nr:hypothetical protein E3U55_12510 [Filobacillus milosensis]